ncbi:hypothetical protein LWI28_013446 [Acer negundo]|uniref:BZIP domain-containing protein n=1 Tax=Acer negundo TaxID=4023 RepID=A0AAD5IUL5_ACENE|nr:hypothetical protein LWI28_013446 [Acer negundo]KAK4847231.1 hypothetical protein QYF36_027332 [Acer negundo]
MEDGQNMNPAATQDSLMMKSLDQRDHTKSRSDIMTRRLKNRERQRRYRARKRLEADTKKSSVPNQTTTPQIELQLNGNLSNSVTRVYCKRDWKKDARRASTFKGQDTPNGSVKPATESQTLCLPSGNKAEALQERECYSFSLVDCETNKTKLGCRRDWKADARKKKS